MIFVQNIALHFAGTYLFENVSFRINKGDKIGLVGKNGAGKSTFLKLLSRKMQASEGSVDYEGDISVGYLTQDLEFESGRSLWEETELAFKELKELELQITTINEQLLIRTDYESDAYSKLIENLTTKSERFELLGGYTYHAQMEQILFGLGFKRADFDKQTELFSGGWRMRIELAKLLLQQHSVLLLDEPTNHLDIDSIIWFENFLKNYTGAVVLISHDIHFLDSVTNRTLEIANRKISDFPANYKRYLILKEERREILLAQQKNQEREIKRTEDLIDKFRAKANKASMAQSLIKKLDKVDRIEVETDDVNKMNIRFQQSVVPGKIILELENVSKSFSDKKIFDKVNFYINRGEKIAFVGQNGQGKSTLSKMIVGDLQGDGHIKLGHNVVLGYFAQSQEMAGHRTVLEEAEHAATLETHRMVRDLLGAFLFSGDNVHKKVSVLSGGERGRLALCKLLLQPFNTLVLDEPTNHLDIQSKNILKEALQQFKGTFIIVSHDRDFMEGLVDKVFEFKDGAVKEFLGGINDYLQSRQAQDFRTIEKTNVNTATSLPKTIKNNALNTVDKERKRLENKANQLEIAIATLEHKLLETEQKLADNHTDIHYITEYNDLKNSIQEQMKEWETIQEQLG